MSAPSTNPTTKLAYTPADVVAMTPRGKNAVNDALKAGMLVGTQNGNRRSGRWLITPQALNDWVERGCPFPAPAPHRRTA